MVEVQDCEEKQSETLGFNKRPTQGGTVGGQKDQDWWVV